ncbi:hypothetical protein LSAT2_003261 [Lamellibrachia satsuma]|nr:hypothetical protein LSAT2_003261 [Lamellibrachia satsuma]
MFPSQEIERDRTATICQGRVRERHAYTTISHRLQVVILGRTELIEQPMFLLKYKVYGCPDVQPTPSIWVRRTGESVTCGCNSSNLRWKLHCRNDTWVGQKYNCSSTAMRRRNSRLTPPWFSFSYEIGVTIVIGIAVVVASLIFCIGMICLKRNMTEQRRRQPVCHGRLPDRELVAVEPGNRAIYGDTFVRKANDRGAYEMGRIGDNEYASIQDVSAGTYPEHAHGAAPAYTGCAPFQSYSSLEPPLEKAASGTADDVTAVTSHPMFSSGNGHQYFVVEQDSEIELVNCRT